MMSTVAEHYENHLAPVYPWMVGDFNAACDRADEFYSHILPAADDSLLAVDLGCGHGVHAIPLARRGYRVLAIDNSAHLLAELEKNRGDLPINAVNSDLTDFSRHLRSEPASLIACMGDTLTHLESLDAVDLLLRDCVRALSTDGILAVSFRDYATHELTGSDRFIPVRSDDKRIHTCFLDYRFDTVVVHDILHSWVDSSWRMSVGSYQKLRISPDSFVSTVESLRLALVYRAIDRGMMYFAFARSKP